MEPELRDIHLPDPITWWPPAPGWWILSIVGICSCIAIYLTIRYILKPTAKKQALIILAQIERNYDATHDPQTCLKDLSALIRRVAITEDPIYAGLTGPSWLQHLDKKLKEPEFSSGVGKILLSGPYHPAPNDNQLPQVIDLCRRWVEAK